MTLQQQLQQYSYKTELHAHSFPVSGCGKFSAADVVKLYIQAGCDTLTLTNHFNEHLIACRSVQEATEFYLSDYYAACKAAKGTSLCVALGVELRFAGTTDDFLVYGICPDDIEHLLSFIKTDIHTFYKKFKTPKNAIIHAHPMRSTAGPTPIGSVDGIESFNTHPGHNSRIAVACRFARENGLTVTGGSDFHEEGRHATCLMRTKSLLRDSYDIAEAILSRDVVFDLSGHAVLPYIY